MSLSENREESLFEAALQIPAVQRCEFLAKACGADDELRNRIEGLLKAFDRAGGFLENPAVSATTRREIVSTLPGEKPGDRIGRYKLLEQIGEGGCGVVYVAEQEEPVRRRVALKIIKLGMDTKCVIARFDAERQALAMMDHPNIAKVLDAGATETGRPYFVMELVRGIKITDYCNQNCLAPRARLELFIQVCRAIQHAHQKGIIHRDVKPSNILVTLHDGIPVPKVIDFGIAKATQGRLTDETVYTAFEQFIGTPAYMSPEQAEMSGFDIDTRSDIYSLGVLLYELLTGKTPFDAKELLAAGLDQIRRTVREVEPVKPSTRITQDLTAADVKNISPSSEIQRKVPHDFLHEVRGDLDWIVMKCLEKDRRRRYETANDLVSDINRHLENEPIEAHPPTSFYRLQKAIQRNKLACAAATAIVLVLAIGFATTTWMFVKAKTALQRALLAENEEARLRQKSEVSEQISQAARQRAEARQMALLYWQALDALPDIDIEDLENAFETASADRKPAEILAARYDKTFSLLEQTAEISSPCDWAFNPAEDNLKKSPRSQQVLHAMHAARLRAQIALLRGDPSVAAKDLIGVFVLGRQLASNTLLPDIETQIEIESRTAEFVAEKFRLFTSDSLATLHQRIENSPPHIYVRDCLENDKSTEWMIRQLEQIEKSVSPNNQPAALRHLFISLIGWDEAFVDRLIHSRAGSPSTLLVELCAAIPLDQAWKRVAEATPSKLSEEAAVLQTLLKNSTNTFSRFLPDVRNARAQEIEALTRLDMLKAAIALQQRGQIQFNQVKDPFGSSPFRFVPKLSGTELHSEIEQYNLNGFLLFRGLNTR